MSGSLLDIGSSATRLPDQLIFDTSVIIEWLMAAGQEDRLGRTWRQQQVVSFVEHLRDQGGVGLITGPSLIELWHFFFKAALRRALPRYRNELAVLLPDIRRPTWRHLYKTHPHLLKRLAPELTQMMESISSGGLVVLQPEDIYRLPAEQPYEAAILWAMARYELDSADAAIVMEARRAGVPHLVTLDHDLWRAQLDLDVYTWFQ